MFDGQYFGLTGRPFQLTPDPEFWFESASHRKAMAYLGYGLALGEGFVVITGEIGAGKTTLLGHLLATLDRARVDAVDVSPAILSQDGAIEALASAVGITSTASHAEMQAALEAHIAQLARMGKRLLIAVDEAQSLSEHALEQMRLISNINQGNKPILQFLLLGQPEFRETLELPSLAQLNQRVIARHHLTALNSDEILEYLEHRLRHVGWIGKPALSQELPVKLVALTGGMPRLINQIMTRALLMAALSGQDEINPALLDAVQSELEAEAKGQDQIPAAEPAAHIIDAPLTSEAPSFDMRAEFAEISARLSAQEAALQRLLRLMLQWVEAPEQRRATGDAKMPETWS